KGTRSSLPNRLSTRIYIAARRIGMTSQRLATAILCALLSLPLVAIASISRKGSESHELHGAVQSGEAPIAFSIVSLYSAGTQHPGAGAALLGRGLTDLNGNFQILYKSPKNDRTVLYVVAETRSPLKLVGVLDPIAVPDDVVINERSTVATAYAMAQFTNRQQ